MKWTISVEDMKRLRQVQACDECTADQQKACPGSLVTCWAVDQLFRCDRCLNKIVEWIRKEFGVVWRINPGAGR